jgi:hypothetical protein
MDSVAPSFTFTAALAIAIYRPSMGVSFIIVEVIKVIEKHFQRWDYQAVQELEQMCRTIPILNRGEAIAFFKEAGRLTKRDLK